METPFISALIAALVSLVGVLVALYTSKHQLRTKVQELDLKRDEIANQLRIKLHELNLKREEIATKLDELDLKRQEIEGIGRTLTAEAEALRQNMMRDILAKRMAAYAALWKVFISYERNWLLNDKTFDVAWAKRFTTELNACNAEHGVFFSQEVYEAFFEYRGRLYGLWKRLRAGDELSKADLDGLVEISSKGIKGEMVSLATAMKNDLGSYMRVAIRA